MFRAALQSKTLPVKGAPNRTIQSVALRAVWKRLFTSQPVTRSYGGNTWWRRSSPIELLRGIPRPGAATRSGCGPAKFLGGSQKRGFRFSAWRSNSGSSDGGKKSLSLSERLKKLSREYGWSAVGVYLALSVLDFPFCFLLVRIVGTDRIGQIEHFIVTSVAGFIPESARAWWCEYRQSLKEAESKQLGDSEIGDKVEMVGWGVEEAQQRHKEEASLATQLALAYAIHKSFIFIRVPLTAAVTPKVVKVLRSWGWNIGKRTPRWME